MKKTLQLFTLVWLSLAFMPARAVQLSGAYTIDSAATASATEFKDFTSAIIYMTSTGTRPDGGPSNSGTVGVSGPVVFNVLTGTYVEQVNIPAIAGASATNTVTFDGGAGNASTRILQFLATAASDNHTLRFNACSFVNVRNLTIQAMGGAAGVAVQFLGAVNNISVVKCRILAASTTTTSVKAINVSNSNVSATGGGCSSSSSTAFRIFIDSNYVFGGNIGIFISSSASTQSGGSFNFFIRWNEIFGAGSTGISGSNTQGYMIKWNYIKMSTISASSKGIHHCNGSTSGINYYDVSYNVIEDAGAYGIHFQSNNPNSSALYPTRITNNYIKPTFRSATSYGMDFSQPRNHKVFNNTILMNMANGIGINLGASANAGCIIKNNIIQLLNTASTNLCIISGGANLDSCDYNVFTKGGSQPNLLSVRGATYTRTNFIGGGGNNVFSTMDDPMILGGVNDPRPSNICQKGENHWLVDTLDLNGTLRGVPPQIGCAEAIGGISLDANPVAILEPVSFPVVSGAQNAKVIIKNSGTATLTSLNVSIQVGTATTTVGWTGSLLSCQIDTVEFTGTNQITLAAGTNLMRVWTSGPNAAIDSNANNDTIQRTYCTPLATGNYTIGATGTFASFAEVAAVLNCGGISGTTPTIFDVQAGVYNEQFALGAINGLSETTPIIFRSLDANADSVKITFLSTGNNYLVQLAGTNYITFDKITFESLSTASGRIFDIGGSASYNKIQDCKLILPLFNATGNTMAHIFANGATGKRNEIKNNTFTNGGFGMYWYGQALTATLDSTVIDNNRFDNVYYMTLACSFNSNTQITRNQINPGSFTTTYAIYFINSKDGNNISYNRVQGQFGAYGIMLSSVNGTVLLPTRVTNNVVTGGVASSYYGMYIGSATNMLVSHNSVSANSSAAINYAFWTQFTSTSGTSVVIRNNAFRSTGTAVAITNAPMYVYHKDYINSNFNNIFNQNHTVLVNVATPAIQHLNIHSWRAANPFDKNSISYHPGFTSNADARPNPADSAVWSLNGHGAYLAHDTVDFVGNPRPRTFAQGAPDLGAYEFTPTSVPPLATTTASQLAPDSMQIFMFAGDTVAKVKWSSSYSAPASIFVRQFCGMRPPHIDTMATNHMNFHTNFEVPFGFYGYDMQLFYKENWRGLMQNETDIRMAKFDSSLMFIAPWTAYTGSNSSVDTIANIISAPGLSGFSFFTGTDNNNPLPVVLGRFVASKENSDAALFWTTASEVNSDRFEIERSVDGRNFTAVGRVNASGNSNTLKSYRFMDVNPLMGRKGIAYYRLKMIDRDRSYAYSQVVTVDFGRELRPIGLSLFPNPYTNDFNAIVEIDQADKGEVVVYDLQGKVMHTEAKSFEAGENNVYINTLAGLPAGVYVLEVKTNNHQQVIRFVKGN